MTLKQNSNILVNRAGVGFLFADTEFWQHFDDLLGLDLKYARQLVDTDFTHI